MSRGPTFTMPARYDAVARLGQGGGGEVWVVRDRVTGERFALKALAEDAGEPESLALVREASTLSGLEGLGVPRVIAFGHLPRSERRYLVRELVPGESLEQVLASSAGGAWLRPVASAAEQLSVLHRAGLFHGDVKPANLIVGEDGEGTLVDLGLAAPWREGGARARGLTPRYAAPELLAGEALTVRGEVYALGATLRDALGARASELDTTTRSALEKIAERATRDDPQARYPSVDELASALKSAAKLPTRAFDAAAAWPIVGLERVAQALGAEVTRLGAGEGLALVGPRHSGRSTILRRLAWTLGIGGTPVASVDSALGSPSSRDLVEQEVGVWGDAGGLVLVVDDLVRLDDGARDALRAAVSRGARLVAAGSPADVAEITGKTADDVRRFDVPPLTERDAADLVRRAIPSLPERLTDHLVARADRRPGALRAFVKRLGASAVTSVEEVDEIFDAPSRPYVAPPSRSRAEALGELGRALDTGRVDVAGDALTALGDAQDDDEAAVFAVARAKIALARGDTAAIAASGEAIDVALAAGPSEGRARSLRVARARTLVRAGDFAAAASLAVDAAAGARDADASDALAVRGVALAYLGEEASALEALEAAVAIAKELDDARALAVSLGSLAIAHQRGGRPEQAHESYEAALFAAEAAKDGWTIATTRLNLAGLAKADGDLAKALHHLEAALDMGRRTGGLMAVQQSLFNLANLDLYLGRYARAAASIDGLAEQRAHLSPSARAQLLGLQAEHATRLGDVERGARLYDLCAVAYEAVARPFDAAEARLEGLLARSQTPAFDPTAAARDLGEVRAKVEGGDLREHEPVALLVESAIAAAKDDPARARACLDTAHQRAVAGGMKEWTIRALEARARLSASQGSFALARRDTEAALALLEETAFKLPRDLREVFWDDPRRRDLREAQTTTASHAFAPPPSRHAATAAEGGTLTLTSRATVTSMGAPLPAEDRLARIFEITRDLAREHDLEHLLSRVTDHAVGLLGAERGLIVLVDDDGQLATHTSRGSRGEEAAQSFSRSVAERVIESGEPVIATSARDDARLAEAVSVHQLMIQSIACVPIRGAPPAGRTIGALYLETRLRPGLRFQKELPTLAAFADQAAIAIESARLLDENKRRARELEIANDELVAAKDKLAELLGRRTEQLHTARRDLRQARAELRSHFGYGGLVGTSAAMRKLYALIERVRDTDIPVIVTGESGTGKEVVARAVHVSGSRAKQPFLGVNCGAIPRNLLESELFGHMRGAFTGADRDRKGVFREAEGGTLLLDEIGEMPLEMQAGLLRVLQEKTVRPVGGIKEEPYTARLIAATNRDLSQMVAAGTFREDLFYRLQVVELKIPPLRERADDIPALIDHFLTLFAARHKRERKTIERGAVRRLQSHDWPGNVRQLEHVLLNAWLLSEGGEITAEDLDLPTTSSVRPKAPAEPRASAVAQPRARSESEFRDAEKDRILSALQRCNWNRVQAAKLIGVPRRTFYRRLKEYGIL